MRKILIPLLLIAGTVSADDLWFMNQKGKRLFDKGEFEKALEQFDSTAAKFPGTQEPHFNRALTLAQLGRISEAKDILKGIKFSDTTKSAELSYTEGKIADIEGDAAIQKQDIAGAKKAYASALEHYVQTLAQDSSRTDALKNVELTAGKLMQLPEPPENEDQQDQNKDQQNQDQNEDQQDQNKDQQDKENQDDQQQDQNEDENKDENQDDQNKDDQQDEEKEDDQQQDQNEDEQKDQQDDQQQEQPQPEQPDSVAMNAMMLLEKYADDAEELNKPPKGKAVPVEGGKDW